ncbi:MAG TPA: hypothetical protein VF867_19815, partial [Arthrobacter sp.]
MVNSTPTLTNMAAAQPGGSVASRHTAGAMTSMVDHHMGRPFSWDSANGGFYSRLSSLRGLRFS